ncbi:MAG: ATP-binding cassette domain-containing protein [Planctomycetota bacterium]|nr:ATP-binding cassette domain-containing protein [Planctomycetota bacterium]
MPNVKFRVENLEIGHGNHTVAGPWSFSVSSGGLNVMRGPNGCGKSTFARTLLGLIPALSGTIEWDASHHCRWVPQQLPLTDDFPVSVRDIVELGLWDTPDSGSAFKGLKPRYKGSKSMKQKVTEILQRVGLEGMENRRFARLSGGEQRRALIARALVSDAECIVLDEPMNGVDLQGRDSLGSLISSLAENPETLFFVITHDSSWIPVTPRCYLDLTTNGEITLEESC